MTATPASTDVEKLLAHIDGKITDWKDMFDGWPGNIELALIDAVLSIQARYGNDPTKGIRGSLLRYRDKSGRHSWDDLEMLAAMERGQLIEILANRQKTGGVTKAEAIVNAAKRFLATGVAHSTDIQPNSAVQRDAYCGTKGLGPITWEYFLMLLGNDGVKPDVLVSRFVAEALGRSVEYTEVINLIREAASRLNKPVGALDHSIWNHVSRRPRQAMAIVE